eukprot:4556712-Pleurochrysis_carterae.AAC.1
MHGNLLAFALRHTKLSVSHSCETDSQGLRLEIQHSLAIDKDPESSMPDKEFYNELHFWAQVIVEGQRGGADGVRAW